MTTVIHSFDWARQDPPARFADLVEMDDPSECRLAILGLADDLGVRLNGGRPGAARGPTSFRMALGRYGTATPAGLTWPRVYDAGDVVPGDTLYETHHRVTRAAGALLDQGLLPVGIGGGHDLTFPLVRAVAEREKEALAGIYLDAHLDVRGEEGSGMPFRRLVEECGVEQLHVRGLDPYANSTEHRRWFREHGGREEGFGADDEWPAAPLFFSLDLDVLDQAHAPGVSATNPNGWAPARVERWVQAAGRNPGLRCFDIMELSPPWDEGERTARLAARLFLAFLHGFTERGP